MKTPYTTKTGIQIGCNYHPTVNYHNPDQDWIQGVALGDKKFWTTETVVLCTIWGLVIYAIAGLLSACSSPQPLPTTPIATYNSPPVVPLVVDSRAQQMSRNEVIQAVTECETNSLRAVVVTSKRLISGMMSDIPVDVQCFPTRSIWSSK